VALPLVKEDACFVELLLTVGDDIWYFPVDSRSVVGGASDRRSSGSNGELWFSLGLSSSLLSSRALERLRRKSLWLSIICGFSMM